MPYTLTYISYSSTDIFDELINFDPDFGYEIFDAEGIPGAG